MVVRRGQMELRCSQCGASGRARQVQPPTRGRMKTLTSEQPNGQPAPDLDVLEVLLLDPTISEIDVLGHERISVVRRGKRELTDRRFRSAQQLLQIITWLVGRAGQRLDQDSSVIDGQLPDGSQLRVVLAPAGADGPTLSIRRVPLE